MPECQDCITNTDIELWIGVVIVNTGADLNVNEYIHV